MLPGSEHNDEFYVDADGRTRTRSNRSGGIQVRPCPPLLPLPPLLPP